MFDLIIRNGHVFDPSTHTDEVKDIFIHDGRFCDREDVDPKAQELDASGLYVFPGLIENHCHCYYGVSDLGIQPDLILIPNGVTSCIDYGSSGYINFADFHRNVIERSQMDVKAYLNVSPTGIISNFIFEKFEPDNVNIPLFSRCYEQYKDSIVGIKARLGKDNLSEWGTEPLKAAIKIAEKLGLHVAVHVKDSPIPVSEIARLLRKGDIWVHMHQLGGHTFLDENGKLDPEIVKAKERGVLFDGAGGRTNYSFSMIRSQMEQGLHPDFIGTDIVNFNAYERPMFALPHMMTVFLAMGMTLEEVIEKVTVAPAKIMKMENEIGTIRKGAKGDLAIMRIDEKPRVFKDSRKDELTVNRLFVPMVTVKEGTILYRSIEV
ncbi:MAG: amidohydrolase family protein [Erysipelotrichaceae bacterium]|nr:amidohydrolase family protein [Erysipelotrichaceae bacterium]